jgi:hypothetical protein
MHGDTILNNPRGLRDTQQYHIRRRGRVGWGANTIVGEIGVEQEFMRQADNGVYSNYLSK